jgi:hypothetical protein
MLRRPPTPLLGDGDPAPTQGVSDGVQFVTQGQYDGTPRVPHNPLAHW